MKICVANLELFHAYRQMNKAILISAPQGREHACNYGYMTSTLPKFDEHFTIGHWWRDCLPVRRIWRLLFQILLVQCIQMLVSGIPKSLSTAGYKVPTKHIFTADTVLLHLHFHYNVHAYYECDFSRCKSRLC
jgi:hypothetical protein